MAPEKKDDSRRLLKNAHLRRCPRPSSLRRTSKYASLLRISGALHLSIFEQPARNGFFSKLLEIIGEAAGRVYREFRNAHPEIPWQRIIGLRNVLIHEYGDIEDGLVWEVASVHVPDLVLKLEPLIPHPPADNEE